MTTKPKKIRGLYKDGAGLWKPDLNTRVNLRRGEEKIRKAQKRQDGEKS